MPLIADFDRFDVAVCSVIAMLIAAAYGMSKRDTSEFADPDKQPSLVDIVTVWITVGMFSSLLLTILVRR